MCKLEKACSELSPSQFTVVQMSSNIRRLLIVSEVFQDMTITDRIKKIQDLLKKEAPDEYKGSIYIIEPVTEEEFKRLRRLYGRDIYTFTTMVWSKLCLW